MEFLSVQGLGRAESDAWVLQDVSFTIDKGQRLAIAGATGSGKSSLMRCIAGLTQPHAGAVYFGGEKVLGPDEKLIPGHPKIAYLSQQFELRNHYRIEELLEYANQLEDEEAQELYAICRIDHLMKRENIQVSGGERQRIALARLLVQKPELLLLDEPFSNLDLHHKTLLKEVLAHAEQDLGLTIVLVSHEPSDILAWADTLLVLQEGRIAQQGTPEALYRQPADSYVAGLLGPYNKIEARTALADALTNGKGGVLRPEDLLVHASKGFPVTVLHAAFLGRDYMLTLRHADGQLLARSAQPYAAGHKLFITARDNRE
jgi:ABC-type sugar transport system ATPase subunit